MIKKTLIALSIITSCISSNAFSMEQKTTASNRVDVGLTIYNDGLALVREKRDIHILPNTTDLAFADISKNIKAETVAVSGIDILEQNLEYDLLTPQSLLEKHLGKTIWVARHDVNGQNQDYKQAKVLSLNDGVVLEFKEPSKHGKIEIVNSESNYKYMFPHLPSNLRTTPTLVMKLADGAQGRKEIDMSYLSTNFSWKSDYVILLNDNYKSGKIINWITLNNNSGTTFSNAQLQLMAGELNRVRNRGHYEHDNMMSKSMMDGAPREESIGGYHLYSIPRKVTLKNNQQKQIKLFTGYEISFLHEYKDVAHVDIYANQTEYVKSKPTQILSFINQKPSLGIPMPKGIVRVYTNDNKGKTQFVGEDRIGHTAAEEDVNLTLGKSFDLTVERKTIKSDKITKRLRRFQRSIVVKNGGNKEELVEVVETLPGTEWRVGNFTMVNSALAIERAINFEKTSPRALTLKVKVPAHGNVKITYDGEYY